MNLLPKITATVRKKIPNPIKKAVRKVYKSRLQQDIEKFKKTGTRFRPPLRHFPGIVRFEVTTRCNLHCAHCPHSALSKDKNFLGDMDKELYFKAINEIAAQSPDTTVRPFGGGEPLCRKDLAELIGYAKKKGIQKTSINTNGTLLTKNRRTELIKNGLDHIEVSIDAATSETYAKVRQADFFHKVVDNTIAYIDESKQLNKNSRTTVSFVLQKDNQNELEAFKRFWEKKVDQVVIRPYHQHGGLIDAHGNLFKNGVSIPRHPCPYVWRGLIISIHAKVCFCESDWKAEHTLGDIRHQSIKEIWQGPEFNRLREQHIAGTFDHPLCNACPDWQKIKWPGM